MVEKSFPRLASEVAKLKGHLCRSQLPLKSMGPGMAADMWHLSRADLLRPAAWQQQVGTVLTLEWHAVPVQNSWLPISLGPSYEALLQHMLQHTVAILAHHSWA